MTARQWDFIVSRAVLVLLAALALALIAFGAFARPRCSDPFTMLESAQMRAERAHGVAAMVQGSMALLMAYAVNHTGDPTEYRGDTLIIWSEPDNNKASVAFVLDGCGTGEAAVFSTKAFAGVLIKAYPKRKTEWHPLRDNIGRRSGLR